ncbi:hypothetical protein B566_EDAN015625 [Ephemera danica]|nr:hypothetical protein B566_EDAN015625 [Ephemera danica]
MQPSPGNDIISLVFSLKALESFSIDINSKYQSTLMHGLKFVFYIKIVYLLLNFNLFGVQELGGAVNPQVLLGNLPMVVPSEAQLQLNESGTSTGTLQMASADGSMSMPVTLTMEDGQLVAHIPTDSQFLSKKPENEGRNAKSNITTGQDSEERDTGLQYQIVTEDGRPVQLISTPGNESTAFSVNFENTT